MGSFVLTIVAVVMGNAAWSCVRWLWRKAEGPNRRVRGRARKVYRSMRKGKQIRHAPTENEKAFWTGAQLWAYTIDMEQSFHHGSALIGYPKPATCGYWSYPMTQSWEDLFSHVRWPWDRGMLGYEYMPACRFCLQLAPKKVRKQLAKIPPYEAEGWCAND